MISLLLGVIYLAFVSLGLPDSLLGSAWPVMHRQLGAPLSMAGVITTIISCATITSSLFSDRVIRRFGTGVVTAFSVGLTAVALLGFSMADSIWVICLLAVPYGLGAGAVDAGLNNYIALHYSSRQMSWLHAFWGVGVTISPYIMSFGLSRQFGWEWGYRTVAGLQAILVVILIASLPLWKKHTASAIGEKTAPALPMKQILKLPGAGCVLLAFFAYCAAESTAGLWASSYLVNFRGVEAETAARFAALFYLGITAGRIINGFIADRFGDRTMIRVGIIGMLLGIFLVLLPVGSPMPALVGLVVIGLGGAPIYPCIIHSTPVNFGKENSQAMVGVQMACAYTGTTLLPPLFGLIAQYVHMGLYPVFLGTLALLMLIMTERLNRRASN